MGAIESLLDRKECGLRVQRIEDGLDHQNVRAALDQADGGVPVGRGKIVEGDVAERGIVDVGRNRRRAVGGSEHARDQSRPRRSRAFVTGLSRQARAFLVELADEMFETVIGLRSLGRGEGVGLDDIGAGIDVGVADIAHDVGARQRKKVVVAFELAWMVAEAIAAKVLFAQSIALDQHAP